MKMSIVFSLLMIIFFVGLFISSFEYSKIDIKKAHVSQTRTYIPPDVKRFGFTHNWVRR